MAKKFVIANGLGEAEAGQFVHGPCSEVPSEWLGLDGLVLAIEDGKQPVLAHEEVLPFASRMGEGMFRKLQALDESMALAAARGEDATPGFDKRWRVIESLMDASPWTFHPDHGLIRRDQLEVMEAVIANCTHKFEYRGAQEGGCASDIEGDEEVDAPHRLPTP